MILLDSASNPKMHCAIGRYNIANRMQEAGIYFALQTSGNRTWIFLHINCVAFELSNKRILNRPIRPAGGSKSLWMSSIQIMNSTRMKISPTG